MSAAVDKFGGGDIIGGLPKGALVVAFSLFRIGFQGVRPRAGKIGGLKFCL